MGEAPYAVVQVGDQEFRTRPHHGGGRDPEWDETFVLRITYENTVEISIRDAHSSHDKCIGVAKINLAKVRLDGRDSHHAPVHSPDSGHQHGHLHLALHFQPEAVQAPAVASQQAAASLGPAGYQCLCPPQQGYPLPAAPAPAYSAPAYSTATAYHPQPQAYACCGAQPHATQPPPAPLGQAQSPAFGIPGGYPAPPSWAPVTPTTAAPDPYAAAAAALAERERQELLRERQEDRRELWEGRRERRELRREEREMWREADYGWGGPGLLFW
ncbi:hypothetical protein HYH03_016179 [Edaphochlamys debaryana]|uniref:C2 domain-containing protein n=1 Tax=Edaphochlamys debaryana TaxID=47281 RepID=A0A836BQJ1_9CHLO|nr:hypothetical protein HYH03_016179 [Edaphochlamys debaryana]|eukprot:KAG2485082.1 hypothetical protein HYH03_016179 [Edaphochlamys debaryana]